MAKPRKYKITSQHRTRLLSMQVDRRLRSAGIPANGQAIRRVSATEFHRAISAGKKSQLQDVAWMVDVHSRSEYRGMKCYLTADGKSGMAIKKDGDVVSLFSAVKGSRAMGKLIPFAVANGGRKLDCYGGGLQNMYAKYGARAIGRVEFSEGALDDETTWRPEYGRPDVVAMTLPGSLDEVIKSYNPKAQIDLKTVKLYQGEGAEPYDRMIAARDKVVENRRGSTSALGLTVG